MGQKRSYKQYSKEFQVSRYLVIDFGTSKSPKSTRKRDRLICPDHPGQLQLRTASLGSSTLQYSK
jgi:hypothetical protein